MPFSAEKEENLFNTMREQPEKASLYLREYGDYSEFPSGIRYLLETGDKNNVFWVFHVSKIDAHTREPYELLFIGPDRHVYSARVMNRVNYLCSIKPILRLDPAYLGNLNYEIRQDKDFKKGLVKVFYRANDVKFEIYFDQKTDPVLWGSDLKMISACLASQAYLMSHGEDRYILTNTTHLDRNLHAKTIFQRLRQGTLDDLFEVE